MSAIADRVRASRLDTTDKFNGFQAAPWALPGLRESNDSKVPGLLLPGLRASKAPCIQGSVPPMNALQVSSADGSWYEVQAMQTPLQEVADE